MSNSSSEIPVVSVSVVSPRRRPLFFRKATDFVVSVFSVFALVLAVGAMAWILFTVVSHGD